MQHIVMFSSGIGSWAAAKRVAAKHGTSDLILLFADTKIEDEDNYRFLHESAKNVGGELVIVADGRTPQELFLDSEFLGTSKLAICSRELKQDQCRKWLKENANKDDILYVGIDWSEIHRLAAIQKGWSKYECRAPLTEPPYLDKLQLIKWAKEEGLTPPRLYNLGFHHANCGGSCVRAGQKQWKHLLKVFPDRYKEWEEFEIKFQEQTGKNRTILKQQIDGKTEPLSLKDLRERVENAPRQLDLFADDWGGCGCFVEFEE